MKLSKLLKLCKDFNIDPSTVTLYGEHDVVYVGFTEEDELKLPKDENNEPCTYCETGAIEETFWNTYGIGIIEGYWGSYT